MKDDKYSNHKKLWRKDLDNELSQVEALKELEWSRAEIARREDIETLNRLWDEGKVVTYFRDKKIKFKEDSIMEEKKDDWLVQQHEFNIKQNKQLRKDLDECLQDLRAIELSRERAIAITKLQEAIMWLGMDLKRLGEQNPYPDSYKPSNTKIAPTADGLKM